VTSRVQLVALVGSSLFLLLVLELVRRRRLAEEYSALWIGAALALLAAALRRDLIDRAAVWLGIVYGPAVLLLGLLGVGAAALLWMTVVLSRQQAHIDRLIEETAILGAELRGMRDATHGPTGARATSERSGAEAAGRVVGGASERRLQLAKR
jgi:hypothetical protein